MILLAVIWKGIMDKEKQENPKEESKELIADKGGNPAPKIQINYA